jgi:signal transduction histidine kinase/ActR/RegA family two-component response regulator
MQRFSLAEIERKYFQDIGILFGFLIVAGIVCLFVIDVSQPRGVVDGVGYAALVALCIRFGARSVVAAAVTTSALTIIASFLLPNSGISVAGMWANRSFALAEIWIITIIILRRLTLEAELAARENGLVAQQAAIGQIIREALLADKTEEERIRRITELSAEAMKCDLAAVWEAGDNPNMTRTADVWDRSARKHLVIPDHPVNDEPEYRLTMESTFVAYADDVLTSPMHKSRLKLFESVGVRAILTADTFADQPGRPSVAFAFRKPHRWTTQEIAFSRGVANMVSLLFAAKRNAETLAALDQVSEGIYAEDKNGKLQYANRAAMALSRTGADGAEPQFPRPEVPLTSAGDMYEISYEDRDLEIQRMRLRGNGTLTRINDVTARNAALAARHQFEARLQQSAKMEAIGQLAGGIAHDFNNILGSIMGFAGFLAQDLPATSAEHGFTTRILNACTRGKELVEQILSFARARAVERGVVDIGLLLKRNHDHLRGLFPPQIKFDISYADLALPVFGSAAQIGQLITNLCLNARDALGDNSGLIEITARLATAQEVDGLRDDRDLEYERVFGEAKKDKSYCLLRVSDNGEGIAPALLDRIFEPFFTTKGRHRGTGLGLAVVHGVVESTGGVCRVSSRPGAGTTFSIYLPIAGEADKGAGLPADEPAALRGTERVLIVDDEQDIADMLAIGLERLGYEAVGINDPLEALAAFTEDPEAFDVVITDQVMPGLRGLDLIRRLKEIRLGVRAILCTGFSDGANAEISSEAGADAFFHKPVDARKIAPKIRALMKDGQ